MKCDWFESKKYFSSFWVSAEASCTTSEASIWSDSSDKIAYFPFGSIMPGASLLLEFVIIEFLETIPPVSF